jgi:poly(A) polymerase
MDRIEPQPWMTDKATQRVLDALEAAGGEGAARFVGGCVRDTLVGLPVADVDIATPLTPDRVIAALEAAGVRSVPTGIEHGTVTAVADRRPFEVTTLRRDVETDGRRAVVAFSEDWAEDASRRDFRLNALYVDREGRLFDYVGGGVEDALAGRIVFVGDAEQRIREDYLRVLRFFRFYAWYGKGGPDADGLAACARLKDGLAKLSAERISKELLRLLAAPDPKPAVRLMAETGVLAVLLPFSLELKRFEDMVAISEDADLRLSALLADDPGIVAMAAERLRLANSQRDRLLAAASPVDLGLDPKAARGAIYRAGPPVFADRVLRAWAANPERAQEARRLLEQAAGWTPPRFPLGGGDVAALGIPMGPEVGRLLREVETWWIEQDFPEIGARKRLRDLAKDLK